MRQHPRPPIKLSEDAVWSQPVFSAMGRRRLLIVCTWLAFPTWCAWAGQSYDPAVEDQVKAAFLYKFGGYVDWPADVFERPDSPLTIGVMGSEAFTTVLTQIAAGRDVNGHSVAIRRLQRGGSVGGLHMIFVAQPDEASVLETVAAAKGQSILIVTSHEKGLADGGMINFVVEDNKVRFDIAIPTAEQSNLKISARLLGVARKVVTKPS